MNNQTLFVFKKQQQEYNMVRKLKKVTKQLKKASKLHANQAKIVKKYVKKTRKKEKDPKVGTGKSLKVLVVDYTQMRTQRIQ